MSAPSQCCRIEMLGALQVILPDRTFDRFRTQKTALLLAYLAHHSQRSHPREHLITLLWPDADIDAGRDSLTTALTSLRRQLEPAGVLIGSVLQADRQKVRLNPDAFRTDVAEFESLLITALAPQDGQEASERFLLLQQAVALYRDKFLAGHYEDWILLEQARLSARFVEATLALAEAHEQAGSLEQALAAAHKAVMVDPYREEMFHLIMRLQARQGQPATALETYRQFEQRLRDEINAAPTRLLRDLADRIQHDPKAFQSTPPRATPPPAPAILLALPTPASSVPTVMLPLQTTGFFGRDKEVQQLVALLRPDTTSGIYAPKRRLVTLTGPGGIGKTRLSIETARELASCFAGGVWFVSLADVPNPRLLPFALAHALQIRSAPNEDLFQQIVDKLSTLPTLLILDNYEHLLRDQDVSKIENPNAADASVLVRLLLERAPQVSLLITSRRALNLGGEQEFPLDALAIPTQASSPEALQAFASVALYQDRAQYVLPDFALTVRNAEAVGQLCRKLEGVPLALEMAAAWVATVSPGQMLARLESRLDLLVSRRRDLPARQRSLRAAIEWSYDLLTPELRELFVRLAVFRGGWSVEAASAVCELSITNCLEGLSELQQHSLVIYEESDKARTEGRYRLLEMLRQFGSEKLEETGEAEAVRARYRAWCVEFAEQAEPQIRGPHQQTWLDQVEAEHDNLRSALNGESDRIAFRIAGAIWWFWYIRGYWSEGRERLTKLLPMGETGKCEQERAKMLRGAGVLAWSQGDYAAARTHYAECLVLCRNLGDRNGTAATLNNLGLVAQSQGEFAAAQALYEESLEIRREMGDWPGIANTLSSLGIVARDRDDHAAALTLLEESLKIHREIGDQMSIAYALGNLGLLAADKDDFKTARIRYEECLEICRELGDQYGMANAFEKLGNIARFQDDYSTGRKWYRESLEIYREVGDQSGIVTALENLALLCSAQGKAITAARLWGIAEVQRQALGTAWQAYEQDAYDRHSSETVATLGAEAFEAAWQEGRALTVEEALALV